MSGELSFENFENFYLDCFDHPIAISQEDRVMVQQFAKEGGKEFRQVRLIYGVVCCSVLQCVAVCYSVFQRVAVCCSVLQSIAACCSVLQCVAECGSA